VKATAAIGAKLVSECDLVLQLTLGLQHWPHDPGHLGLIRHEGPDPLREGAAMRHYYHEAEDLQDAADLVGQLGSHAHQLQASAQRARSRCASNNFTWALRYLPVRTI